MIIAAARLELFLPETHSLKEKRHVLKRIMGRTTEKFGIPVAEVEFQDLWQRAALGFAVVGNDGAHLSSLLDRIVESIESMDLARVIERRTELIDF